MTNFIFENWTFEPYREIDGRPTYKATKMIKYNHHRIAYVQDRNGRLVETDRLGMPSFRQRMVPPKTLAAFREYLAGG